MQKKRRGHEKIDAPVDFKNYEAAKKARIAHVKLST